MHLDSMQRRPPASARAIATAGNYKTVKTEDIRQQQTHNAVNTRIAASAVEDDKNCNGNEVSLRSTASETPGAKLSRSCRLECAVLPVLMTTPSLEHRLARQSFC